MAMYIGNPGGTTPMPGPMPQFNPGGVVNKYPTPGPPRGPEGGLPGGVTNAGMGAGPVGPSNVLQAGTVRPTGPSAGYDPQYLQNLATAIGGLFSRPGGNLSFNPLGDLSDISSPSLGFGNAPSPGLPSTMLQDAINGLAFLFNPPAATTGTTANPVTGGGIGGGNNNGGPRRVLLS